MEEYHKQGFDEGGALCVRCVLCQRNEAEIACALCVCALTLSPNSVMGSPISLSLFRTRLSDVGTTTLRAFFAISISRRYASCAAFAACVEALSAKVSADTPEMLMF